MPDFFPLGRKCSDGHERGGLAKSHRYHSSSCAKHMFAEREKWSCAIGLAMPDGLTSGIALCT